MAIQRPVTSRTPAVAPRPNAPPPQRPTSAARPPRRGVWTFFSLFLFALALIGGEIAAHYEADLALSFRTAVSGLLGRPLPGTLTPELLLQVAGGITVVLILLLIWQAGRQRRPLFLPIALFLCLVSATVGFYRGGRDLDLERNLSRLRTLETDLGAAQKKLELATGSLQKSTLALQERDELLSKLRLEIDALQKQLEEKK
jgi:hypothetical protein